MKQKINVSSLTKPLRRAKSERVMSDVLGSYTGMGEHNERPVQDADDL